MDETTKTPSLQQALRPLFGAPGYFLGERFAAGGMGSVHFGLKRGALGFQRVVAVKRMHPHLAQSPEFVARFKHEIRLVSRLSHPNVVDTLDVIEAEGEVTLIMEYVDGDTLYDLLKDARESDTRLAIPAVVGIVSQALHGLHAAHEARDDAGNPLNLVHRDVSPQNIMIGRDGVVKILDFGVAKARSEEPLTCVGEVLGKVAYMSPEQALARALDRRSDIFTAGIVLWEALSGQRLFRAPDASGLGPLMKLLHTRPRPPSELREGVSPELDAITLRALARDPSARFGSARDFALALERAVPGASASVVAHALSTICHDRGVRRAQLLTSLQAGLTQLTEPANDVFALKRETATNERALENQETITEATAATLLRYDDPDLHSRDLKGVFVGSAGPEPKARRRSRAWALLPLVAISFLGLLAAHSRLDARTSTPSSPPAAARGLVSPSATHAAAQPVPIAAAQPDLVRSTPEQGSARIEASTPEARETRGFPATADAPTKLRSRAAARKAPVKASKSSRSAVPERDETTCSPPTYVDADGIRHFKPECL